MAIELPPSTAYVLWTDTDPETLRLYSLLPEFLRKADENDSTCTGGYPLLRWLDLQVRWYGSVAALMDRFNYPTVNTSTSDLGDPYTSDDEWLNWLGQLVSVSVSQVPGLTSSSTWSFLSTFVDISADGIPQWWEWQGDSSSSVRDGTRTWSALQDSNLSQRSQLNPVRDAIEHRRSLSSSYTTARSAYGYYDGSSPSIANAARAVLSGSQYAWAGNLTDLQNLGPVAPLTVDLAGSSTDYFMMNKTVELGRALVLPGTVGNNVSTPHVSGLDITGNHEIVACLTADDWSTGAQRWIFYKGASELTANYSFQLNVNDDLVWAALTSAGVQYSGMVPAPKTLVADGVHLWVKMTRDNTSGVHTWYYNTTSPPELEPTTWSSGGTQTIAPGATLTTNAQSLFIGTTNGLSGRIYRIAVRNGIGGTPVFDVDFTKQVESSTSFSESTSKTMTVNQSASQPKAQIYTGRIIKMAMERIASSGTTNQSMTYGGSISISQTTLSLNVGIGAVSATGVIPNGGRATVEVWLDFNYPGNCKVYATHTPYGGVKTVVINSTNVTHTITRPSGTNLMTFGRNFAGRLYSATFDTTVCNSGSFVVNDLYLNTGYSKSSDGVTWTNSGGNSMTFVYLGTPYTGAATASPEWTRIHVLVRASEKPTDQVLLNAIETVRPAGCEIVLHTASETSSTETDILRAATLFIDTGLSTLTGGKLTNLGTGGSSMDGQLGSTTSADAADPVFLAHTGTSYLYTPGVDQNYVSLAATPALAITGNLEIVVRANFDSVNGLIDNVNRRLVVKSPSYSLSFYNNQIVVQTWTAGAIDQRIITVSPLLTGDKWLKWTYTASTGTSVIYSSSTDSSYAQIGISTTAVNHPIDSANTPLTIAANPAGQEGFIGNIYRVIIRNGIAGTTVLDVDFTTGITSGGQVSVPFTGTALTSTPTPQYYSNLGTGGRALVARTGINLLADGADPSLLRYTGERYVYTPGTDINYVAVRDNGGALELSGTAGTTYLYLPGITGQYATVPSAALYNFGGDIEVVARFSSSSYLVAGGQNVFGRSLSGQWHWQMVIGQTGQLQFAYSTDGVTANAVFVSASASPAWVAGTTYWIKMTRRQSDGRHQFWYAADQATEPTGAGWTQSGIDVTSGATLATYTAGSSPLEFNTRNNGATAQPVVTKFYRAIIRNGIDGAKVFDSDFTTAIIGAPNFTDSIIGVSGAPLVTLNGSLTKFVDGTTFLSLGGATGSYASMPSNAGVALSGDLEIVVRVALQDWTPATNNTLIAKRNDSLASNDYSLRVGASGQFVLDTRKPDNTGFNTASITWGSSLVDGTTYWIRVTRTGVLVSLYVVADQALEPTSWGTAVTTATPAEGMLAGTAAIEIGSRNLGGNDIADGRFYRAIIRNGVGGTVGMDVDFTQQQSGATPITERSANSGVFTVNSATPGDARIERVRDLEIVCRAALDDWYAVNQPVNGYMLIAKGYASDFIWYLGPTNISLGLGMTPAVFVSVAWSSRPADGVAVWLKVTRAALTGVITFYTAADSVNEPTSWTTIGSTTSTTGNFPKSATAIAVGAAVQVVGSTGFIPTPGKFYRAIVRNGIGGPAILDLDFTKSIVSGNQTELLVGGTVAQYANNLSTVANTSTLLARSGTLPATDGSDPVLLKHYGENYLYLPGVINNNATLPDSSALSSLTGNIEFVIRVALDDWTPAANQPLLVRWAFNYGYSWALHVNITSGALVFSWFDNATSSASGVGGIVAAAAAPTGLIDGVPAWLRCRFNISNRQLSVEWAADSPTEPTSWGTASLSTAGASTTIYHAKAPLEMGTFEGGSFSPTTGKFYRAIIRNGFSGTAVVDVDFTTGITSGNQVSVPFTGTALNTALAPQYLSNLGTGGRTLAARLGSSPYVGSDDPAVLPWTGENYLYCPGVAGNGASAPDSAALDITGDIEMVCRVALDDWTITPAQHFMAKRDASASYLFRVSPASSGKIEIAWWSATLATVAQSTIALPATDGVCYWLKATLDVDNTAGGKDTNFYYAADQATEPTVWTQLGATVTTAGTTSIDATTAALYIGVGSTGTTEPIFGKFYRAIVRNGIGGPTVFDANFTTGITSGAQTTFTESSSNAATVTINRSATGRKTAVVTRPTILFGTDDFMEVVDSDLLDFGASDPFTLVVAVRQWATYADQRYLAKNGSGVGYRLGNGGAGNNYFSVDTAPTGLVQQASQAAGVLAVTAGVRSGGTVQVSVNGATSASSVDNTWGVSSPSTTGTFRISGQYNSGGNADMEFFGAAVFRRALTQTEITLINTHYQGTETTASIALLATATLWIDPARSVQEMAILRSTSGKKTVAVTRSSWLFSSSTYMEVKDDDLLDVGTGESLTALVIARVWAGNAYGRFISKQGGNTNAGWEVLGPLTGTSVNGSLGTGSVISGSSAVDITAGHLSMAGLQFNRVGGANNTARSIVNLTFGATSSTTSVGTTTLANGFPMRIGLRADYPAGGQDMELVAVVVYKGVYSDAQLTSIYNHYIGGTGEATTILQAAQFWIDADKSVPTATVVRSGTGRKTVCVTRPTLLFGTNDYLEVSDNNLIDFSAADSFTVVGAVRQWGTVPADSRIVMKWSNAGGIQSGWYLTNGSSFPAQYMSVNGVSAGTASATNTTATTGTVNTMIGVRNTATDQVTLYVNGVAGTALADSTVGTIANPGPMTIGRQDIGGAQYADMEFFGAAVFRRALSATEIALINTHYQGVETTASVALLSTAVFWIDPARSAQELGITRSTTGKKAVAVARPVLLVSAGTYLSIPDNALLNFDGTQSFTVLAVLRAWATPSSFTYVMKKSASLVPTGQKGWDLRFNVAPSISGAMGDGYASNNYSNYYTYGNIGYGPLSVFGMRRKSGVQGSFLNDSFGNTTTNSYDTTNTSALIVGSADMEIVAVAIFRRALNADEIAAIAAYYGIS